MNKQAKILVTGGTGLIGSYLIRLLLKRGFSKIIATHNRAAFELVEDIKDQVEWHRIDIEDDVAYSEIIIGVDTVIHCAGMISLWPKEFKEMFRVNVNGTANIVNLCLLHDVKRLIHLSSIEALGKEEDGSTISEKTEWKEEITHTKYAQSKYYGELEVHRGHAEGLHTIIYNPALVLGAGLWNAGPMSLVQEVYKGLNYYPRGSMAMIDVRDLVKTIVDNIDNEQMNGERYIVGSYNEKFKSLINQLAESLDVAKPQKALVGMVAKIAIRLEKIKSVFTNSKPLINKESFLVTDQNLSYSFNKLNAIYTYSPYPFEQTINDVTDSFKASLESGQSYSVFEID